MHVLALDTSYVNEEAVLFQQWAKSKEYIGKRPQCLRTAFGPENSIALPRRLG